MEERFSSNLGDIEIGDMCWGLTKAICIYQFKQLCSMNFQIEVFKETMENEGHPFKAPK